MLFFPSALIHVSQISSISGLTIVSNLFRIFISVSVILSAVHRGQEKNHSGKKRRRVCTKEKSFRA